MLKLIKGESGKISVACKIGEGGGDVPLSAADVVVASSEATGATLVALSISERLSPRDELCRLRAPRIFRIASLYSSAFSLLYLACGAFAPLLTVRSISHISLELFVTVGRQGEG